MNNKEQADLADRTNSLVRHGIETVLKGEAKSFEINPFKPDTVAVYPQSVVDILEPMGWEAGEMETNGWQYDWWLPFTKGEQSFTASGSGYNGGFTFGPTEE